MYTGTDTRLRQSNEEHFDSKQEMKAINISNQLLIPNSSLVMLMNFMGSRAELHLNIVYTCRDIPV
jgi:hypothetical protein